MIFSAIRATLFGAVFLTGVLALRADPVPANYPAWWYDGAIPGTSIINSATGASHAVPDNYGPVNVGQLKWVATRAKNYLDVKLASVGGSQIDLTKFFPAMPATSDPGYAAALAMNYTPANVGQLKAVTDLFYNRLQQAGFDTNAYLRAGGYPSTWTELKPWPAGGSTDVNYTTANLGQLKLAFGFNLNGFTPDANFSSSGDGIPDSWKVAHGLSLTGNIANLDPDGDGLTNLQEYLLGTDPNVADSGTVSGSATRTYTYDALGRLTNANTGVTEAFTYDAEGNLTSSNGQ